MSDERINNMSEQEEEIPGNIAFALQEQALEAYSVLSETFKVDENGYVTYPDDFAGAWIDDNKLHIATTSSQQKTLNNYKKLLNNFDCIVYETAEYSLNELDIIRNNVFNDLREKHPVVNHHVDVKENKINFGFLELDKKSIESSLSSILSESNSDIERSLNKTISKTLDTDLFILSEGELIEDEADIVGGMRITHNNASGPGRSIGACGSFVMSDGTKYNGIITAGHYLAVSGSDKIIFRNGSDFGRVEVISWNNNVNGDWACIRMTSNDTLTNKIYGSSTGFTRNITATLDDVPVGTKVMKFGITSGYAEATVTAQNVSQVSSSTGYTVNGLTRAALNTGDSAGGDSGGPYYTLRSGNSYNFVGVHKGSGSGIGNVFFTPYVRFKHRFTVKTS